MTTEPCYPVMAISRLRMLTDGAGVTTLVAATGCPLRCAYCLNPQNWNEKNARPMTAEELYARVRMDDLYFRATGGGVVFGGGEPLTHARFIARFREVCGGAWRLLAETSLNVPAENAKIAAEALDECIVDIKDMNPAIYRAYAQADNARMKSNLAWLLRKMGPERVVVRVPRIPNINTDADVDRSIAELRQMGAERFDRFVYTLRNA